MRDDSTVSSSLTCDFSLPAEPVSVPASRAIAGHALEAWGFPREDSLRQTALLVVSELVTNSVKHAARLSPSVDVGLALTGDELTVTVHDSDPRPPVAAARAREDGSGGWGLRLIMDLAVEQGGGFAVRADLEGPGKTVSARLPLGA